MTKSDLPALERAYAEGLARYLDEWRELLAFKSVSAQPEHGADCAACAAWLAEHLQRMGLCAALLETGSQPVVFAEFSGDPARPSTLFYGHYDVQPVDPLALWESDPFIADLRGDRLYARGAQDNKGQLFYFIKALETLIEKKIPLGTVKLLLEGEEESGSAGIRRSLPAWSDRIKADVLMVCDSGCAAPGVPAIMLGLRGLVGLTVRLGGIKHDLHSGLHGGVVKNPALEMARLLATLHGPDGRVAVAGFYHEVRPASAEERELLAKIPFDAARYKEEIGVAPLGGEQGFPPKERLGFRPTLEVNGVHSGYGGPGLKTVIGCEAVAKLSARLVAQQDPRRTLDLIVSHLTAHAPAGLELMLSDFEVAGPALHCDLRGPMVQRARGVLGQVFGREPVFDWMGGSIPIVSDLVSAVGGEALLIGTGLDENNIHAPNEFFSLEQFKQGYLYAGLMLQAIAD